MLLNSALCLQTFGIPQPLLFGVKVSDSHSACDRKITYPFLLLYISKENEWPFPWKTTLTPKLVGPQTDGPVTTMENDSLSSGNDPNLQGWFLNLPTALQSKASLRAIALQTTSMAFIDFDLPRPNMTAGRVLQHCIGVMERTFQRLDPLIFKVGFTHNPAWRWSNKLYGYGHAVEKWSNMVVLYVTDEPHGPAMLEAALIEKFKSTWSIYIYIKKLFFSVLVFF